ncbi:hypothetical protein COO60DRAFT_332867 [Scenedesmus sp. NREL 46B-D3]|nr:hypothetical protein COO60DRAFT_332867 [Scenedesmus sp. NREL 46B-D3]
MLSWHAAPSTATQLALLMQMHVVRVNCNCLPSQNPKYTSDCSEAPLSNAPPTKDRLDATTHCNQCARRIMSGASCHSLASESTADHRRTCGLLTASPTKKYTLMPPPCY